MSWKEDRRLGDFLHRTIVTVNKKLWIDLEAGPASEEDHHGHTTKALLAAGHNLCLILNELRLLFAGFMNALSSAVASPDKWSRPCP